MQYQEVAFPLFIYLDVYGILWFTFALIFKLLLILEFKT